MVVDFYVQKKGEIKNPLTSVVMPTYNAESLLSRAVISALTQDTEHKYEIVIVDDGSRTPVESFLEKSILDDPKISLLRKSNGGISSAMNAGTEFASGNNIVLLDSDDEILPLAVQYITDEFLKDKDISYVYTDCFWVGRLQGWNWENYSPVKLNPESFVNPWIKRDFDPDLLLEEMYLGHARAYSKESFKLVGGFDERHSCKAEDWDFALKVSEVGDVSRVPVKLHKYYLQENGITSTSKMEDVFSSQRQIILDVMARRNLSVDNLPKSVVKKYGLA